MQAAGKMESERRKHARKKPEKLVYVELGTNNGGMMRDLSEGGLGFRAVSAVHKGDRVKFAFSFDGTERLEGVGQLVWTDEEGKVARLQFTEVTGEFHEQLRKWLMQKPEPLAPEREIVSPVVVVPTLEDLRLEIRGERVQMPAEEAAAEALAPEMPAPEVRDEKAYEMTARVVAAEEARLLPGDARAREFHVRVSQEPREPLDEEIAGTKWVERVTLSQAIGAMLVLTLLAVAFVYHQAVGQSLIWLGGKIAGSERSTEPAAEEPAREPSPARDTPASPRAEGAQSSPRPVVTSPSAQAATGGSAAGEILQSLSNQEPGQPEFLQAIQILHGKSKTGDLAEAVRLLWAAVEKGHSGAEVALADLYRRGEGVAKSCNQARVLLTAAARKGNAEAKRRLEQFEREGCQ